ncbi:zinc ribbon domain-containing protein [Paenibacillus sp. FSL H8-0317]|uniref:zinc ribbon domain-containing protein n=1 Tax=unclassified Paenibacillus TaxID=185978 RepID=UPI0030D14E5C
MFCSNCGTKLTDNAKFCSSCGTAVQEAPQHLVQQKEEPVSIQKIQQDTEVFNLLGYDVIIPKETKDYVTIRYEFQQLAREARDRMARNFDTQYHSLDDLIRNGDNDADDIFYSALEYAVNMLNSKGVYSIDMIRFGDIALKYTGYWEDHFCEIREKFKELVEYKESQKDYRSIRKAGRGRMVGGGFGVGGALKGMAMAGTANMATGMLHSFTNALGNASTNAEVSSMKKKIFKDPETKRTLCLSVYYDVFNLHMAVVECINDRKLSSVADTYTSSEREEAMIIYNNIVNGSVKNEDLEYMIVEILENDPFDLAYYELALNYKSAEEEDDLINYARYFKIPIDALVQDLQTDIQNRERLTQLFGEFGLELEQKLRNNRLFHSIKTELSENPIRAIQKAFISIQNEAIKSKVFLVLGDSTDKLTKKMENVKSSYAPIQAENPLLLFDSTVFGSAKDGFLITDHRIYVHNMMEKGWNISFQEIEQMSLLDSSILIDGKRVDINLISGKDRDQFYDFVELLVFVQKYGSTIGLSKGSIEINNASSELHSSNGEVSATVSVTNNEMKNTDQVVEEIKNTVLNIKNEGIRRYLFLENENEKVNKKFKNALEAYAKLEFDEKPVVLFDNTAFGSAKDGFIITNRQIYIHNMFQKPFRININSIISVELKGSDLLLNQHVVGINMISSSDRSEFRTYMEDFINRLM